MCRGGGEKNFVKKRCVVDSLSLPFGWGAVKKEGKGKSGKESVQHV